MYERYFKLAEKPFNLTPDTKYLYLSANHHETYAQLIYGVQENVGFMTVIGEIGTGKTMLTRAFLNQLQENIVPALIINPSVGETELLQAINKELKIFYQSENRPELLDALYQFLFAQRKGGKRVVLIIDEAQALSPSVFEQLRMISNFESETEKLVSIILVGQPELSQILDRPDLRQLNQRISIRSYLLPLSFEETKNYILHRLRVAGAEGNIHFTRWAFWKIYRLSTGIPRVINKICDRALLAGYTHGTKRITGRIIRESAREVTGRTFIVEYHRFNHTSTFYLSLVLVAVAGMFLYVSRPMSLSGAMGHGVEMVNRVLDTDEAQGKIPSRREGIQNLDEVQEFLKQAYAAPAGSPSEPAGSPAENEKLPDTMGDAPSVERSQTQDTAPTQLAALEPADPAPAIDPPASAPTPSAPEKAENSDPGETPFPLKDYLLQWDKDESKVEAVNLLLALWHSNQYATLAEGNLTVSDLARSRGLECSPIPFSLSILKNYNLPAVLSIRIPGTEENRYVAALKFHDSDVYFDLALKHSLPEKDLKAVAGGEMFIFWKDFEKLPPVVKPESRGKEVAWIQKSLARLGYIDKSNTTGYYGEMTAGAVRKFQQDAGLLVDGMFGQESKIILYNKLNIYHTPLLSKS